MNEYYFTFGQEHYNNEGRPMRDSWVRVEAPSARQARELFIEQFSSIHMPSSDVWAFQYSDSDFRPEFFPDGEYLALTTRKQEV